MHEGDCNVVSFSLVSQLLQGQNRSLVGRNSSPEGQNNFLEGRNSSLEGRNSSLEGRNSCLDGWSSEVALCLRLLEGPDRAAKEGL